MEQFLCFPVDQITERISIEFGVERFLRLRENTAQPAGSGQRARMVTDTFDDLGPFLQATHDLSDGGAAAGVGEKDATGAAPLRGHQTQFGQLRHGLGDIVFRGVDLARDEFDGHPLLGSATDREPHHRAQPEIGEPRQLHVPRLPITTLIPPSESAFTPVSSITPPSTDFATGAMAHTPRSGGAPVTGKGLAT